MWKTLYNFLQLVESCRMGCFGWICVTFSNSRTRL